MPIIRSISMSWARWCISCSFAASSMSKRVRDGGSAPGRNVMTSARNESSSVSSSRGELFAFDSLSSATISAFVRGFASSAPTFFMYSAKSIFSIGDALAVQHRRKRRGDGDVHQRLRDRPRLGRRLEARTVFSGMSSAI